MAILVRIEPVFIPQDTIIFRELEEISEVIFVLSGNVHVGFEVNRRTKFVVQFTDKALIGAFNCTFNKKTSFVYKSKSDVSGYMIRKEPWQSLMSDHGQISEFFTENIEYSYKRDIKDRVMQEKHKYMKMLQNRAAGDENFIMLINKDERPSNYNDT